MIASLLAAPWAVSKLPRDCLIDTSGDQSACGIVQHSILILKNVLGVLIGILGVLMLITPGPGLIMILIGLALTSFPGKRVLMHRIGRQKTVFQTLNWMRARYQQPPFLHPDEQH